jgi:CubicO group peptidase (beta-lactamase class C family)
MRCLALGSVVISLALGGAAVAGTIPDRVAKAAEARIEAGQYPALVIGMIADGKSEVVGFGKLDNGRAPDGGTVFEIGSVTKTFTATLLADAVQANRVALDEPVEKLLPGFTIPARNGRSITLADLSDQHSGLPRMPSNVVPADPANPYADYDAAKLKAFLAGYKLPRDPGASYEYSNLGEGLLGYALATSAHTDYGTLLHEKIFAPLAMNDSAVTMTDAMRSQLAFGHTDSGKPAKNWDFDTLAGAGAIKSTAHDMLLYLRANMGVDHTPLDGAMHLAQTPRADMDGQDRVGFAWITRTTPKGQIVWHNGMTGGYASFVGFTADGTHGVVVLTDAASSVDDLGFAALDSDALIATAVKAVAMSDAELDAYTGRYKLAENFVLRIFRAEHQLYGQATGQGPFPLFASAPNEFFAKVTALSVSFKRDAKGAVTGLVLHQNGDRTAPRMPDEPVVALDAATLGGYVGKYQLLPSVVFDITLKDGQLSAQLTGQPAFPVFASAKDKFFYKVVDAQLDFERDAAGKVVALVLHQGGRDQRAPRTAP